MLTIKDGWWYTMDELTSRQELHQWKYFMGLGKLDKNAKIAGLNLSTKFESIYGLFMDTGPAYCYSQSRVFVISNVSSKMMVYILSLAEKQ